MENPALVLVALGNKVLRYQGSKASRPQPLGGAYCGYQNYTVTCGKKKKKVGIGESRN